MFKAVYRSPVQKGLFIHICVCGVQPCLHEYLLLVSFLGNCTPALPLFFDFHIVEKCFLSSFCLDSNWNIECWIKGKLDLLVCSLLFLKLHLRPDLKVNLLYAV